MKELKRKHFLKRFKFDVQIERKGDASRLQSELARIFNFQLERLLDKVLTEFDNPDFITSIPYIELDLGEIPEYFLDKEFAARFEKLLRKEMTMIMAEVKLNDKMVSNERASQVRLAPANIDILAYFLVNGHLNTGLEGMAGSIEQLFLELMKQEPEEVAEMLQLAVKRSDNVLRRLVNNFSEKTVKRMYAILAPSHAMAVESFEKKIYNEAKKVLVGAPDAKIRRLLRRAILYHLLFESSNVFDTHKFKKSVYDTVVEGLGEEVKVAFKDEVEPKQEADSDLDLAKKKEKSLDLLIKVLRNTPTGESETKIIEAWEFLIANAPDSLKKILINEAETRADAVANLVKVIPTQGIRDFLVELSPSAANSMISTVVNVISAHGVLQLGYAKHEKVVAEVHVAVMKFFLKHPNATANSAIIAEEIKKHLSQISDPPKQLLEDWKNLGLLAPTELKKAKEKEAAEKKALEREIEEIQKQVKKIEKAEAEAKEKEAEIDASIREQKEQLQEIEKELKEKRQRIQEAEELAKEAAADEKDSPFLYEWEEDSRSDEGVLVPPRLADFDRPTITTVEGKLEYVLYYIETGKNPWWFEPVGPTPVDGFFSTLIEKHPDALIESVRGLLKRTPRTKYRAIVSRLVSDFSERIQTDFIQLFVPEIASFFVTIGMALRLLYDEKSEGMKLPPHLKQKFQFAMHHPMRYLLEYLSATPTPTQLLKYVIAELSKDLGLTPRALLKDLGSVADKAISKGERRYLPLKSMLPKPFDTFDIPQPQAHSEEEIALTTQSLAQRAVLQDQLEKLTQEKFTEALRAFEVEKQQIRQAAEQVIEQEKAVLEAQEKEAEEKEAEEKSAEEIIELEAKKAAEKEIEQAKLIAEEIEAAKEKAIEQADEIVAENLEEAKIEAAKIEEAKIEAAKIEAERKIEKREKALFEQAQAEAELELEKVAAQLEQEEAELRAEELSPSEFVEMVRHYLTHGSLSKKATMIFDLETFKTAVAQSFSYSDREMVRMLRVVSEKQEARFRIIALGDEVAINAIGILNVSIAERLKTFVRELSELFEASTSPIPKILVFEHAIRYALKRKSSSFLPLDFMQDFFAYVTNTPERKLKDVLFWAAKQLESSKSPLQSTLIDMVDAVERLEEVRHQRKKTKKPDQEKRKSPKKNLADEIYVSNAGMVIFCGYLPQLFNVHELLNEDRKSFRSEQHATRAIHLMQYMVDLEIDPPEEKLVLNKLFVGFEVDHPLMPLEAPLTEDEMASMASLTNAILQRWTIMKNSNPDYMRQTFFKRDGRLTKKGDIWTLRVEKKGFDILVNKIPWAINPVRLPWLEFNIDVDW